MLAVPGNLGSAASEGCNDLIKSNKAALYADPQDLEQLLNWDAALHQTGKFKPAPTYSPDDFTPEEFALITVLAAAPSREQQMDDLAWKAQLPIHAVASLLLGLEFRGRGAGAAGQEVCAGVMHLSRLFNNQLNFSCGACRSISTASLQWYRLIRERCFGKLRINVSQPAFKTASTSEL